MRRHLWWLVGLALLVGGVSTALAMRVDLADSAWLAYTPADSGADWEMAWGVGGSSDTGWLLVVSRWQLVGVAVAALGLLVLGAGVGFRLGRRRASAPDAT